MTNRTAVLASLIGAATLWSTHADAAPQPPAWCKVDGADVLDGNYPKDAVKATDPEKAVELLVNNLCDPDAEAAEMRKELEAARGEWSKKLDMTDADWSDATSWVIAQKNREPGFSFSYDGRSLSSMDPLEQYIWLTRPYDGDYEHYLADAFGSKLSEIGRMGYVTACLSEGGSGAWAVCHPDVLAFDYKKVSAEVRTLTKRSGADRMAFRFKARELVTTVAVRVKDVKALTEKDPVFAKLFEIAPPIHKDWATRSTSSLVQLVTAMDDARISGSRKAFAECDGKTYAALTAAISALPAKTFDNIIEDPGVHWLPQLAAQRALADRDVYLAASAYFMCADRDSSPNILATTFSQEMLWHPGFRGPRTESHNAILLANLEPDNKSDRIDLPSSRKPWFGRAHGYFPDLSSGRGVVASVKKGDKDAVITFAKETSQQIRCDSWKTTNKISRIASDGNIEYHGYCTKEHSETIRTEDDPQTVSLRSLTGVKKGVFIMVSAGEVAVVYPKKGAKNPIAVFGATVK